MRWRQHPNRLRGWGGGGRGGTLSGLLVPGSIQYAQNDSLHPPLIVWGRGLNDYNESPV